MYRAFTKTVYTSYTQALTHDKLRLTSILYITRKIDDLISKEAFVRKLIHAQAHNRFKLTIVTRPKKGDLNLNLTEKTVFKVGMFW